MSADERRTSPVTPRVARVSRDREALVRAAMARITAARLADEPYRLETDADREAAGRLALAEETPPHHG